MTRRGGTLCINSARTSSRTCINCSKNSAGSALLDPAAVSLNLVESFADAEEFMRWLGERRPVLACDTETGGLEWWKDRLRLVQFGDPRAGWAVPWQDWGGLVKEAMRRYDGGVVFHNAKFDQHFLEREG